MTWLVSQLVERPNNVHVWTFVYLWRRLRKKYYAYWVQKEKYHIHTNTRASEINMNLSLNAPRQQHRGDEQPMCLPLSSSQALQHLQSALILGLEQITLGTKDYYIIMECNYNN